MASTDGSEYAGAIAIYEGAQDAVSTLACARGRHSFEAEGGIDYWFQVGGGRGVLRFSLEVGVPPRNDSMSSAQGIGRLPFSHEVDAHEATLDLKDPSCFGRGRSVWYSLKARSTDKISLRTIATYDTTISVYQRSSSGLRQLACTGSTRVRFEAERGKTYFIMVGSYQNGPGGLLEFRAKALPEPPPPLRIGLHVEPEGRVSSVTGTARIRGNVSCSVSTKVSLRVVIRQKLHRRVVSGSESRTIKCTKKEKVVRWSLTFAASRPFKKGPAGVYATAEADKKRRARDRIVALTSCGRCL